MSVVNRMTKPEIGCYDNWIEEYCQKCRHFKKREGKQRFDRCTNKEVTTGKYSKETLSGMYYCSEFETFEMYLSKRFCPLTTYPTKCKDDCNSCIYAENVKSERQLALDNGDNRYERRKSK